jgi:hypothetical protein
MVQLEIQWTSHLDSAGGEPSFPPVSISQCLLISSSCRGCPGKHIAHSIVTLAAASVLSTFNLLRKMDDNGQEIEPTKEYKPGAIR